MTTVTLRFQATGTVPGDGRPVTMRGPSLTIGRGQGCDLVLPDPERTISSNHAVIENHNGNVVVIDLSTNGTFLNYGKIALGRTPTPLNPGDVLSIGPYELVVEIAAAAPGLAAPLGEEGVGYGDAARAPDPLALLDQAAPGGDFLDSLLGTAPPAGPAQFKAEPEDPFDQLLAPLGDEQDPFFGSKDPLWEGPAQADHGRTGSESFRPTQAHSAVIPDDWDDLLDLGAPAAPSPAVSSAAAPPPAVPPPATPGVVPPASAPSAPSPPASDDPFAELDDPPQPVPAAGPAGAPAAPEALPAVAAEGGASASASSPATAPLSVPAATATGENAAHAFLRALGAAGQVEGADLAPTMERLGSVLREMITGLREILMTRTQFKGEFRIDRTMIASSGNNPLKFSVSPEQAIEAFARTGAKGYLPADQATRQALDDIRAHEVAMITGMEAALKGLLRRLDPKALEEKLAAKGGAGLFQNRKAKYWELYEEMYAEIADQAENQFQDLFAREFAAAYQAQLERLK